VRGCWAVFDLDGVILDSVGMKQAAFRAVFEDYPEADEIDAYNRANPGVPRRLKIAHVVAEICRQAATPSVIGDLEDRYRAEIADRSEAVVLMAGARELLVRDRPFECVVNSSVPRADIVEALERHGLAETFVEIHGYPKTKAGVLTRLRQTDPNRALIFLGDSQADQDAAGQAHVPFIAVGDEIFRDPVDRISDLADTEAVVRMIMTRARPAHGRNCS